MVDEVKKEESEAAPASLNGEQIQPAVLPQQPDARATTSLPGTTINKGLQQEQAHFDPRRSVVYFHISCLIKIAETADALMEALNNNPKYAHTPAVKNKMDRMAEDLQLVADGSNPALLQACEQMLAIASPGVDFVADGVGVNANLSDKKVVIVASLFKGAKMVHIPLDREGATKAEEAVRAALDRLFPERIIAPPKLII